MRDRGSMVSSLLRDCARLGISALGITSGILLSGKRVFRRRVESWLNDIGFVSREEFEALRECLERSRSKDSKVRKDTQHD